MTIEREVIHMARKRLTQIVSLSAAPAKVAAEEVFLLEDVVGSE